MEIREDYDLMENELEYLESIESLKENEIRTLRIEIDQKLNQTLCELEDLNAQLSKAQCESLVEQCRNNALDAIVGHFGLASVVITNQDGGNVDTTHNVRQGIYASQEEREAYENRGEYNSDSYHKDESYISINRQKSEEKKRGDAKDYMTGKSFAPNDKADLDHIVAAKIIHDDRARVLAEIKGEKLANTKENLALTDSSLNRSKGAKTMREFLDSRDRRIQELEKIKLKGELTESQNREYEKLQKQLEIRDEEALRLDEENRVKIDRKIDGEHYTSPKPYAQAFKTGAKDAGKIAAYTAIGLILKDFVTELMREIRTLLSNSGNKSFKEIFQALKKATEATWKKLQEKWKDIMASSLEGGILAFFSNFIVFVINVFFTTLKNFVRIIRAGFNSLYQAIKIVLNPPSGMPQEEVIVKASEEFAKGIIGVLTMSLGVGILSWLSASPLSAFLNIKTPFSDETLGEALSLCIGASLGAVLSTIVIYYIDQWVNGEKNRKLQVQIMTKSGEVVHCKIAQTCFLAYDAWNAVGSIAGEAEARLKKTNDRLIESGKEVDKDLDELEEICNILKKI